MKTKIHILALSLGAVICIAQSGSSQIGREVGLSTHLQDGEEYQLSVPQLIEHGRKIFTAFLSLSDYDRNSIIEFLKSLQVLPPGTQCLVCDENYHPRQWPPLGR